MKESELEEFTDSVIANQQRLLNNNFVPLVAYRIFWTSTPQSLLSAPLKCLTVCREQISHPYHLLLI